MTTQQLNERIDDLTQQLEEKDELLAELEQDIYDLEHNRNSVDERDSAEWNLLESDRDALVEALLTVYNYELPYDALTQRLLAQGDLRAADAVRRARP